MLKNTQRKDASSNLPINAWNVPKNKRKSFNLTKRQTIALLVAFLIIIVLLATLAIFLFQM